MCTQCASSTGSQLNAYTGNHHQRIWYVHNAREYQIYFKFHMNKIIVKSLIVINVCIFVFVVYIFFFNFYSQNRLKIVNGLCHWALYLHIAYNSTSNIEANEVLCTDFMPAENDILIVELTKKNDTIQRTKQLYKLCF